MRKKLLILYLAVFPFFYFRGLTDFLLILMIALIYTHYTQTVRFKINKKVFNFSLVILIFLLVNSIVSLFYIDTYFSYPLNETIQRFAMQIFRLILFTLQIYLGFIILKVMNKKLFIKILLYSIVLTVVLALYQNIAFRYNLPMWGLYLMDNEKLAIDIVAGFRNSALCGEPKYLAVYMAVALFFVKDISKGKSQIYYYPLFLVILYVFFKASSANGMMALLLLLIITLYIDYKKLFYIMLLSTPILATIFVQYYEYIILRPSHLRLIESLINSSLDMSQMDDLVYLPWLSWKEYSFMLPFGFGLGLMHYYAAEFIAQATWFNINKGYIDSNIAIMSYISNFGIILYLLIILFFTKIMKKKLALFYVK